ncbi:MAG TPA: GNAT family N-acetyltransferase [Longilinea sp.]|nr:GNAT family N-acetyltransferase [Longilinea sp.]
MDKTSITIEGPYTDRSAACEPVLRALPDWFGIETALTNYLEDIDQSPTFLAVREEKVIGFLTVKQHTPFAAELLVMGVYPEIRRGGVGRVLVEKAEAWLTTQGVEYFQVKTLGPSRPDDGYAATRAFYEALGFRPMEELTQIWGEDNPCLILIKRL